MGHCIFTAGYLATSVGKFFSHLHQLGVVRSDLQYLPCNLETNMSLVKGIGAAVHPILKTRIFRISCTNQSIRQLLLGGVGSRNTKKHPSRHLSHTSIRMSVDVPKTCKVILADSIAKKLLAEVTDTLAKIQNVDARKPCLVAFLANDDPAALQYAEWSKKTCEEK